MFLSGYTSCVATLELIRCIRAKFLSHLQGQVCVLLLLPHLKTGQVGVFQLQVVLLLEVLGHCTFYCLPTFQLEGEPGRQETRNDEEVAFAVRRHRRLWVETNDRQLTHPV